MGWITDNYEMRTHLCLFCLYCILILLSHPKWLTDLSNILFPGVPKHLISPGAPSPVPKLVSRLGNNMQPRANPRSFIHLNQLRSPCGFKTKSHGCAPIKLNLISSVPQYWNAWREKGSESSVPSCSFTHNGGPTIPSGKSAYILFKFYIRGYFPCSQVSDCSPLYSVGGLPIHKTFGYNVGWC